MSDLHKNESVAVKEGPVSSSGTSPHDSMVTVRLSEPMLSKFGTTSEPQTKMPALDRYDEVPEDLERMSFVPATQAATFQEKERMVEDDLDMNESDKDTIYEGNVGSAGSLNAKGTEMYVEGEIRRGSSSSGSSVNWESLEKTEEQEPRNQDTEDSTALLLARLEQENNLIVSNPKSGLTRVAQDDAAHKKGRPPSMQQLKQMVNGPTPPSLRYSLLPAPPMTDLEFYAALVQDYKRTAQRLPTLLSKKIRAGIPPPLRGVVWQSMSGARDMALEEEYDRLCGESSPYEGIIGKDLGRSFPGVEMFRDPDGDGQRMLGRVLRCFSLYDNKIGYCQGLGFLVGPLLMHMGDRQAFCVLVRLMDAYDLRACFLPDLSGLHVRIYQFKELLNRHLTKLSAHLDHLQIEPAYVSQWFLSFFAVTCPLPMLFRIYDVIFAEGASETIMRVALSVMRKNEEKILACTEFEDVMQLLLSRGLWDCYHMDADEFVGDFVSLTGIVNKDVLRQLEESFKKSQEVEKTTGPPSDIVSAGSRFLGRIWNSGTKQTTLNPGALSVHKRPQSFLSRKGSKQSMASTLNSVEGSTDSMISSTTEATEMSRKSSNSDMASIRVASSVFKNAVTDQRSVSNANKNLHSQIEDLLTALNEMQKDQQMLMTQLQKEREEREEDRHAVWGLIDVLRKSKSSETVGTQASQDSINTVTPQTELAESTVATSSDASKDETTADATDAVSDVSPNASHAESEQDRDQSPKGTPRDVALATPPRRLSIDEAKDFLYDDSAFTSLFEAVENRFPKNPRPRSSLIQSKLQLRDDLARSKRQLQDEVSRNQELQRRLHDMEVELGHAKDEIHKGHVHIRNGLQEKSRLERLIQDLKSKVPSSVDGDDSGNDRRRSSMQTGGGLRELKLGRGSGSREKPQFNKRTSSLHNVFTGSEPAPPMPPSPSMSIQTSVTSESPQELTPTTSQADTDALILELVQAKTAEAEAKQEAEEAKAKLESLRRLLSSNGSPATDGHSKAPSMSHAPWSFGRKESDNSAKSASTTSSSLTVSDHATPVPSPSTGGGFWGWGKRSASLANITPPASS